MQTAAQASKQVAVVVESGGMYIFSWGEKCTDSDWILAPGSKRSCFWSRGLDPGQDRRCIAPPFSAFRGFDPMSEFIADVQKILRSLGGIS